MKSLLGILFLSLLAFTPAKKNNYTDLSLIFSGSISISGKSNIRPFSCKASTIDKHDTLIVRYMKEDNIYKLENAFLEIDLNGFDCGNPFVDKDFAKLLQKDKYPTLKIDIKQMTLDELKADNLSGKADFEIEIAGINKNYEAKFNSSITNGIGLVEGELELNISDFNLRPPKKLLGLIKVSEKIQIEFRYFIYESGSVYNQYNADLKLD